MVSAFARTKLRSVVFHRDSGTYRGEYDRDATAASTAVVALLSAVTGRDPTALDPLYDSLDPDALDALVSKPSTRSDAVSVTFGVAAGSVTVDSDGVVGAALSGDGRTDERERFTHT